MSRSLFFAYPGDLETRTGGYGYDRRIIAALRDLGWDVRLLPLGEGFPDPGEAQLERAGNALSEIADGQLVMIDGLAFGVLDSWAQKERDRLAIIALVHHPLALETGLNAQQQRSLSTRERRALASTSGVVVTSHATRRELCENYGVNEGHIAVALPGVDPATRRLASRGGEPPLILSVGTLIRRKGHDVLIEALTELGDLSWRCRIVGSKTLDPAAAADLERQIIGAGLADRIELAGEVDDIGRELASADVFALASRYEGYGMVFAEALVHGLPIVGCRAGAVPEVVPDGAGFLVPPDDPHGLAEALRRLVADPETRTAMANAAAVAGARLPTWRDSAAIIADFLETNDERVRQRMALPAGAC